MRVMQVVVVLKRRRGEEEEEEEEEAGQGKSSGRGSEQVVEYNYLLYLPDCTLCVRSFSRPLTHCSSTILFLAPDGLHVEQNTPPHVRSGSSAFHAAGSLSTMSQARYSVSCCSGSIFRSHLKPS